MQMESLSELREVERLCIAKFRQRAGEIKAQHPEWSQQTCFAKAIESLPKTSNKYLQTRDRLLWMGAPSLPLR
jgi:hypothetical protein